MDKLFRCEVERGRVFILEGRVIATRGSWIEIECHGNRFKENGRYRWKKTVMEALEHFVVCRAYCLTLKSMSDQHPRIIKEIASCLDESFRWGELLGSINGLKESSQ